MSSKSQVSKEPDAKQSGQGVPEPVPGLPPLPIAGLDGEPSSS